MNEFEKDKQLVTTVYHAFLFAEKVRIVVLKHIELMALLRYCYEQSTAPVTDVGVQIRLNFVYLMT
jgi:hypothetical protein